MFCPNCGAQNEDVAMFCQSCGQKIPTIAAGPAAPDSTKKRLGTGAKIAIIAGAVLLAAALAVVLFTVFRGKLQQQNAVDVGRDRHGLQLERSCVDNAYAYGC